MYIVTDSFHGTVFSIKFRKQYFSVYTIHSNRIASLLATCGLSKRHLQREQDIVAQLNRPIDYEAVEKVWERERLKADEWIERVKPLVQ